MELRATATISHPLDSVFSAYRDRLPELVPYLPNITAISVDEREELDDRHVRMVNTWAGGGDIPKLIRTVVSAELMRWTDYATWDSIEHTVDWRTEVNAFPGAIVSSGKNQFSEANGITTITIVGQLVCHPDKISAIPRLLRSKAGGAVEQFLGSQVGTNLKQVAAGVTKLLDA